MPHGLGPDDDAAARSSRSSPGGWLTIFLPGKDGGRPVFDGIEIFRNDPHWKDLVLFHEYFHGDTGNGLGA